MAALGRSSYLSGRESVQSTVWVFHPGPERTVKTTSRMNGRHSRLPSIPQPQPSVLSTEGIPGFIPRSPAPVRHLYSHQHRRTSSNEQVVRMSHWPFPIAAVRRCDRGRTSRAAKGITSSLKVVLSYKRHSGRRTQAVERPAP
jgi:hypothetical protein